MNVNIDPPKSDTGFSLKKWTKVLGPGLITAALVFGPGSLTITSRLGALYGHQLFWIIVMSIFFMIFYTEMAVRIGLSTKISSLNVIKNKWGKSISIVMGLGIFTITASFQAGNTIGASLAFAELFGTSTWPWVIFFVSLAMMLLFFKSFYKILEKIMIALVGLMLISFFITLMLAKPDVSSIVGGLIPRIPSGSEMLSIALIASSFSIVGAFYQSYLVKEKGWKTSEVKKGRTESLAGILILGIISSFIMINAATILHPKDIPVNSATDMGLALKPLYGSFATVIFMLGLFSASFSSLIGNATIGGALLSDSFSFGSDLKLKIVRKFIMLVMVIGAIIALKYGRLPLDLIVFAQGITVTIAPIIGFALLLVANDRQIMGRFKNNKWQNIACMFGLVLLMILAINYMCLIFFVN
jgi:manganese transport protein